MCLDTVLQKESFLANTAISLGICSPALPLFLLCLLLLLHFHCWLVFCQQCALTVMCQQLWEHSFSSLPFCSSTRLVGLQASLGCLSSLGSMAKKHQHDGTESRGEYPIGMNCPTDVYACVHSFIHSLTTSFIHPANSYQASTNNLWGGNLWASTNDLTEANHKR